MLYSSGNIAIVAAFNEAYAEWNHPCGHILSVNPGETARSLGPTRARIYRRVIIPNTAMVQHQPWLTPWLAWPRELPSLPVQVLWKSCLNSDFGGADYALLWTVSVALVYWVVNIVIENLGRFIERKIAITADNVETDVKGGFAND